MRFFERFWLGLLGRAEPVTAPAAAPAANLYVVPGANDTPPLAPIPKWTHAGRKGKTIFCSKCGTPAHVYNFSWWALQCRNCQTMLSKYEWLLPVSRKKRKK